MPIALKANITRGQTSNNSTCQDEIDEDEEINLMAKNFRKLSCKGVKPNNKAFVGVTWSDSEDGDKSRNDATCLMAIDSQEVQPNPSIFNNDSNIINLQKDNEELLKFSKDFSKTYEKLLQEECALEKEHSKLFRKINELELEVKKLVSNEEVIKPCQKCVELTQDVDSLNSNVSKLQDETLNFSKFKKSSIVLDDMSSRQKLSQYKEGLGSSKNDKTTSFLKLSLQTLEVPKHPLQEDITQVLIMDLDTQGLEFTLDLVRHEHDSLKDHRITDNGCTNHNNVYRRPLYSYPLNQDKDIIPKSEVFNLGQGLQNLLGHSIVSIKTDHGREFDTEV
ncbi:hypothetical protein Tco_0825251 [Tanacetum coccineum]